MQIFKVLNRNVKLNLNENLKFPREKKNVSSTDNVMNTSEMPISFKIYWALHNIALISSIVITIIYWAILHPSKYNIIAICKDDNNYSVLNELELFCFVLLFFSFFPPL